MKKELEISQIEGEFKRIAEQQTPKDLTLTPENALDLMIEFYHSAHVKGVDSDIPDNDMILFQYGTYDWQDGNGRRFSLDFTRQFILETEDEPYQLSLILYYSSDTIGDMESYSRWSIIDPSISDWATEIRSTMGFKMVSSITPKSFNIRFNQQ
jgi:hypothetical protein